MTKELPRWTYLLTAIGIFVFQTFDGIDGKQARRTNSSTPLGQLFDHGCDAFTWTITSLSIVSLLQLGLTKIAILAMLTTTAKFYLINLLEYYSGVFEYSIGHFDGGSCQFIVIFFNVLPWMAGSGVYSTKDTFTFLPGLLSTEIVLRDYVMVCAAYYGLVNAVIYAYH